MHARVRRRGGAVVLAGLALTASSVHAAEAPENDARAGAAPEEAPVEAVDVVEANAAPPRRQVVWSASVGLAGVGLHPLGGRSAERLGLSAGGVVFVAGGGVVFGPVIVGGVADVFLSRHPRARLENGDRVDLDRPLELMTAGPSVLWYPAGQVGFHVGTSVRAFGIPAQSAVGAAPRLSAQAGVGVQLDLGHDWRVSPGLQLGAAARAFWGTTFRDESGVAAYQVVRLALAFEATFR